MSYIILDLEFNQSYVHTHKEDKKTITSCRFEIIQIGAIKMDSTFNIIDEFNIYIKPNLYKKMHPHISRLTNLSDEFLSDKPTFIDAFKHFDTFLSSDTSHIFCIWGNSDLKALYRNLAYYNMLSSNLILKYIDLQNVVTKHLKYNKGTVIGLETAIKMFELPITETFHDALNDARYTAQILKHLNISDLQAKVFNSKYIQKK